MLRLVNDIIMIVNFPGNPIFSAERTKSTKQDPEGLISRAECLYGVVTQEWVGERVGAYHDWIKKHMKTK